MEASGTIAGPFGNGGGGISVRVAGGRRTTGLELSTGTAAREMTDPVGENMTSRSCANEDLLLMATLGEYMLP